jgi:dethiobiotin synthetase
VRSILITGTDTGIGKTRVAGIIARLLSAQGRVQVVKPVESGCGAGRPADAPLAAGTWARPFTPFALPKPMAPLAAAADAGIEISLTKLLTAVRALPECDWRVLETAGGIAVPIDPCGSDWADFARALKVDHILCVVDDRLGAINQARLAARYCQSRGLLVAHVGIWLNAAHANPEPAIAASNRTGIAACGLPLWGESTFGDGSNAFRVHACPFLAPTPNL